MFAQPDHARKRAQLDDIVGQLEAFAPKVARRLADMADDLLAYAAFPPVHWPDIWSNNPIERLDRETGRRTNVVRTFPNAESIIRLVSAPCRDQRRHDRIRPQLTWPQAPSPASSTTRR